MFDFPFVHVLICFTVITEKRDLVSNIHGLFLITFCFYRILCIV